MRDCRSKAGGGRDFSEKKKVQRKDEETTAIRDVSESASRKGIIHRQILLNRMASWA